MITRTLTIGIALLPITLHAQFYTISPRSIPPMYISTTPIAEDKHDSIPSIDTPEVEPIDTTGLDWTSTPMQSAPPHPTSDDTSTVELASESRASLGTDETNTSAIIELAKDASSEIAEEPISLVGLWCHPPLRGELRITSPYGQRRNPFDSTKTEYHSGLDLAAPQGTPVFTMLPGEVLATGHTERAGNYIKLKHGNIAVTYCHLLRQPTLPLGTHLLPGTPIAQVGSTGRSTAPHLHISVKISNRPIDPALLLHLLKIPY